MGELSIFESDEKANYDYREYLTTEEIQEEIDDLILYKSDVESELIEDMEEYLEKVHHIEFQEKEKQQEDIKNELSKIDELLVFLKKKHNKLKFEVSMKKEIILRWEIDGCGFTQNFKTKEQARCFAEEVKDQWGRNPAVRPAQENTKIDFYMDTEQGMILL